MTRPTRSSRKDGYEETRPATGATASVLHHNGPQYFGYLGDNPQVPNSNMHGNKQFSAALEN